MEDFTICVGTLSAGVFQSLDSGKHWRQAKLGMPFAPWSPWVQVRHITASPHDPQMLLAGSNVGLHKSSDGGANWEFIDSPANQMQVWSTAWHPEEPQTIFVGVAPFDLNRGALFRSKDAGASWETLDFPMASRSKYGAAHITSIAFDPNNPRNMWVGVEVDGLFYSADGGDSWIKLPPIGDTPDSADIHNVAIPESGTILLTNPDGFWRSIDSGRSFTLHKFPPFEDLDKQSVDTGINAYARALLIKAEQPELVFAGVGDYTPGKSGAIYRSSDRGKQWTKCRMSAPANSNVYSIVEHPRDSNTMVAVTMFGNTYVTRNNGEEWEKMPRKLGEISGLAVVPH
jgi:photosystem II stability/assembly factor-like uncharacterized protein